jgi:hypothetical protein
MSGYFRAFIASNKAKSGMLTCSTVSGLKQRVKDYLSSILSPRPYPSPSLLPSDTTITALLHPCWHGPSRIHRNELGLQQDFGTSVLNSNQSFESAPEIILHPAKHINQAIAYYVSHSLQHFHSLFIFSSSSSLPTFVLQHS